MPAAGFAPKKNAEVSKVGYRRPYARIVPTCTKEQHEEETLKADNDVEDDEDDENGKNAGVHENGKNAGVHEPVSVTFMEHPDISVLKKRWSWLSDSGLEFLASNAGMSMLKSRMNDIANSRKTEGGRCEGLAPAYTHPASTVALMKVYRMGYQWDPYSQQYTRNDGILSSLFPEHNLIGPQCLMLMEDNKKLQDLLLTFSAIATSALKEGIILHLVDSGSTCPLTPHRQHMYAPMTTDALIKGVGSQQAVERSIMTYAFLTIALQYEILNLTAGYLMGSAITGSGQKSLTTTLEDSDV